MSDKKYKIEEDLCEVEEEDEIEEEDEESCTKHYSENVIKLSDDIINLIDSDDTEENQDEIDKQIMLTFEKNENLLGELMEMFEDDEKNAFDDYEAAEAEFEYKQGLNERLHKIHKLYNSRKALNNNSSNFNIKPIQFRFPSQKK